MHKRFEDVIKRLQVEIDRGQMVMLEWEYSGDCKIHYGDRSSNDSQAILGEGAFNFIVYSIDCRMTLVDKKGAEKLAPALIRLTRTEIH